MGVAESAQVDNAPDSRIFGGLAEVAGGLEVEFLEAGGAGDAVDEVVGGVDALERFGEGFRLESVADGDFHVVAPGPRQHAPPAADHDADVTVLLQQSRNEPAADIAGSAGYEDGL